MKDDKKKAEPVKTNYTVKLEVLAPITLTYNIVAETEQQALEMMERTLLSPTTMTRVRLSTVKKLKASVYLYGQMVLKTVKNYIR